MTEPDRIPTSSFGERPVLAWIDKRKLKIDDRYQRSIETPASRRLIAYLRDHFTWVKCLPLVITDNGDGTYCVIDGQHRLEAVRTMEGIRDLPCYVVGEMTLQEQALAFVDLNTKRVAVTPLGIHHAKSKAGDPVAREMDRVVAAAGCRIPTLNRLITDMKPGELACIGALKAALAHHKPGLVIAVLRCIKNAWSDAGGIRAEIFTASCTIAAADQDLEKVQKSLAMRRPDQIMAVAYARRAEDRLRPLVAHVMNIIAGQK